MAARWMVALAGAAVCIAEVTLPAAECRVEMVDGAAQGVDPSIAKRLASKHAKIQLDDEELCQIWFAKAWKNAEKPEKPGTVPIEYRLQPGSLVGVIKVPRTLFDLRDQEIPAGVYILRYAVQPEFEAHRDSHESRDFLLLLSPEVDKSPDAWPKLDDMIAQSAESIQTMHPAFMALVKPAAAGRDKNVRRDERDENGWILMTQGADGAGKPVPIDIILLRAMPGA